MPKQRPKRCSTYEQPNGTERDWKPRRCPRKLRNGMRKEEEHTADTDAESKRELEGSATPRRTAVL